MYVFSFFFLGGGGIFNKQVCLDQRSRERNIDDIKQIKERSPLNYTVKFYKGFTITVRLLQLDLLKQNRTLIKEKRSFF